MPNPHFHIRTVDPWVWTRPDQDLPDAEVPDPERVEWGQAFGEIFATSVGPISAAVKLMYRPPALLK
eukprot:1017694-Alexandrium_andersonii.AAC.1